MSSPKVEPKHDFAAKLRQPSLLPRALDYIKWRKAVDKAEADGKTPPEIPDWLGPFSINLDLTTACNYRCDHCIDFDILNSPIRYAHEKLMGSLTNMIERGLRSVIFIGGGEPTLYPKFGEMISFLKERNIQVAIVSNGSRNKVIYDSAEFFVTDGRFSKYFEKYKPDLVFSQHVINFYDRAFVREAKHHSTKTVALVHSWDNFTVNKGTIRVPPDVLLVPNEIIKQEAIELCDFPENRIIVSGWPHFDYYVTEKPSSREEFFKRIGGDPKKRLILFASVGKGFSDTEWQDVQIIKDAIDSGKLPKDIQILVRHHPNPASRMVMGELKESQNVLIDIPGILIETGKGVFEELPYNDMKHFYDILYYSDVVVTTQSTMSIDAAAFDRPVINICFDGWEKKPFYDNSSVNQLYHYNHYLPILQSGGARVVKNADELIEWINLYLENPVIDREGRKRIINEQCWKFDGKAGERIADAIFGVLDGNLRL